MPQQDCSRAGPLDGVRILELGHFVATPFATRLLADLGADVIKVEEPTSGDPLRSFGARLGRHPLWWSSVARNKKLVTLDLRKSEGQDLVLKLVENCDVVVENFRAGQLETWNLGPNRLRARNPRLIVNRISGFGQTGPYKDYLCLATIGEALGGLRYLTGDAQPAERPPVRASLSLGDSLAGLYGAIGMLAALWERDGAATGQGRVIDTAMYEAVFSMLESSISEFGATGAIRKSCGTAHPTIAPSNIYMCGDGKWICLAASGNVLFERLSSLIGRPDLKADPSFATNDARVANAQALDGIIGQWSCQFTAAACEAMLQAASIPAGRIFSVEDCATDPHFAERRAFEAVDVPGTGQVLHPGIVPQFDAAGAVPHIRWAGAELGAHNQEVYVGLLGLAGDELAQLRQRRIV